VHKVQKLQDIKEIQNDEELDKQKTTQASGNHPVYIRTVAICFAENREA